MTRIAYVNGRYVPHRDAVVHVEDRGYQFADGVYEVCAVVDGVIVDAAAHLQRLDRSLGELRIDWTMSHAALFQVLNEVARRNRVRHGIVYLQITRGVARRDHGFPKAAKPALVVTARSTPSGGRSALTEAGVRVVTRPDIRWARRDIKSVSLLPNVLDKQAAREAGAYEAWLVDEQGFVTEGASSNAWIIDGEGNIVTRNAEHAILNGITRLALVELARRDGIRVVQRKFTVDEAKAAREAFLTSTTSFVMPVVQIDDRVIGNGRPGSVANKLLALYESHAERQETAITHS